MRFLLRYTCLLVVLFLAGPSFQADTAIGEAKALPDVLSHQ